MTWTLTAGIRHWTGGAFPEPTADELRPHAGRACPLCTKRLRRNSHLCHPCSMAARRKHD